MSTGNELNDDAAEKKLEIGSMTFRRKNVSQELQAMGFGKKKIAFSQQIIEQ